MTKSLKFFNCVKSDEALIFSNMSQLLKCPLVNLVQNENI